MDIREINQFTDNSIEMNHWWIRTRFLYLKDAVKSALADTKGKPISILEVGSGTGQNLRYLRAHARLSSRIQNLTGVEPAYPDIDKQPKWLNPTDRIVKSFDEVPEDTRFDLLVLMDVLEHLDDEIGMLKKWLKWVRPGGLVFITVPAFQLLWSYHDVFLEHRRRYTRATLKEVATTTELHPLKLHYAFGHLFLPAFFIRVMVRRKKESFQSQSDLKMPPKGLNPILYGLGKTEAFLGGNPWFGTSVVGVFRK